MKHTCKYCWKTLGEYDDKEYGRCEDCIVTFFDLEQEFEDRSECDYLESEWVECRCCGYYYDVLDPYSECGCCWMGDDEE